MARLTPRFSANRTVREYTEKYYIPAATAYKERAADKGAMSVQMVNWRCALEENWSGLRFGEVKAESDAEKYFFEVQVYLNSLNPDSVRVELYAEGVNGGDPVRQEMSRGQQLVGTEEGYIYSAEVASTRPVTDHTVRIIPHYRGVAIPLEAAHILWQR
jgi:starch phosphorylase